ncbi:unnamed protein product [Coccothraustes coccothraustes]
MAGGCRSLAARQALIVCRSSVCAINGRAAFASQPCHRSVCVCPAGSHCRSCHTLSHRHRRAPPAPPSRDARNSAASPTGTNCLPKVSMFTELVEHLPSLLRNKIRQS